VIDGKSAGVSVSPTILFGIAAFFALAFVAIWAVFLRPVPIQVGVGRIASKTFKPAGTYWQYPSGLDRGFRTATPIPIAEADVFQLAVDGFRAPVFFSLNTLASQAFQVGQRVQIRYRQRVIPFVGTRVYVLDISAN